MTERAAWFCPACQRHHAPHCDSCPTQTVEVRPVPTVNVWPTKIIPDAPATTGDPMPSWSYTSRSGITVKTDPSVICIN